MQAEEILHCPMRTAITFLHCLPAVTSVGLTFFPAEESKQRRPCKIIVPHYVSPRQTAAQSHLLNYIAGPHGILHKKAPRTF